MFEDRLKTLRELKGYTQQEIADAIGIPRATYCSYERNQREPTAVVTKRIANFLGVSLDTLLGFETIEMPPDEETGKIIQILPTLSDEERKTVLLFCEFIKSQHKQKN